MKKGNHTFIRLQYVSPLYTTMYSAWEGHSFCIDVPILRDAPALEMTTPPASAMGD